jgi:Spy/CpxP family protein refolding chaperone
MRNQKGEGKMKRLVICLAVLIVFAIPAYAQMAGPHKQAGQGMMGGQQMGMMCPMMQQMHGGQQIMGGIKGERMGRHQPWFKHGVSLILRNSGKLGLNDQQKTKLNEIRRKYSKDIIRQDAELKIVEIDLDAILKVPDMNLGKVKEVLKKIEGIKTQIRYLKIEALAEAKKILTEKQRETLRKIMEEPPPMMMGADETLEVEQAEDAGEVTMPGTGPHGH